MKIRVTINLPSQFEEMYMCFSLDTGIYTPQMFVTSIKPVNLH